MSIFICSDFVKQNNIGIFLNFHIKFAKTSKEILEETISAIEAKSVTEDVCLRLEKMIKGCTKEHNDIEDTYKRVKHQKNEAFCKFEDVLMKLRGICDDLQYLDETVEEISGMVKKSNITVENSSNVQIQHNTTNSTQTLNNTQAFDYQKVFNVLTEIKEYFDMPQFEKTFKDKSDDFKKHVNTTMDLIERNEDASSIKSALAVIKDLAMRAGGSLLATGILQALANLHI